MTLLPSFLRRRAATISFTLTLTAALALGLLSSRAYQQLRQASARFAACLPWSEVTPSSHDTTYEVQVFSSDPLILYFRNFVSSKEIQHLINLAQDRYEVSRIWPDEVGYVDTKARVSESAIIERTDVVRNIEKRARRIMGWRNSNTTIQPIKLQRYRFNGFYNFHFDYDDSRKEGNRMTTLMVYLMDQCTGGGTNFPSLEPPLDQRWCDVVECDSEAVIDYPGVTFKPIAGSAIFWHNFHANGSFHEATLHAGLPVASGEKIGMNVWSWDSSWTAPQT